MLNAKVNSKIVIGKANNNSPSQWWVGLIVAERGGDSDIVVPDLFGLL
jgi:hypothetical protein